MLAAPFSVPEGKLLPINNAGKNVLCVCVKVQGVCVARFKVCVWQGSRCVCGKVQGVCVCVRVVCVKVQGACVRVVCDNINLL